MNIRKHTTPPEIRRLARFLFLLEGFLLLVACSSAPKNSGNVYTERKAAESQLNMGNKNADRGEFDAALLLLNEAWRIAVSTDDPSLRVRVGLARGNVLFALGRGEEAAADWAGALDEAGKYGNEELAAVSRIHQARGRLLDAAARGGPVPAQEVLDEVNRDMAKVKDRLYTAFAWIVTGLSEKELRSYQEAEAMVKKALDIHEKAYAFEQAAYDWYLIASFRSLSGNYDSARQALEQAISLDRRVENSYGLATDWRALGDVLKRAGNSGESRDAYLRSAEIFHSLGNGEEAAATESRIAP